MKCSNFRLKKDNWFGKINIPGKTVMSFICAISISACGGGGSSSDDDASGRSVSGTVLGSYVQGAIVCIDENENARCDSTDTYRITSSANGAYSIKDLPDEVFSKPIVVEVPENARIIDPVSGVETEVSTRYSMSYPPSTDESRHVSSLSTLVHSEFLKTNDLDSAKEAVVGKLTNAGVPVSTDDVLGNYVEDATQSGASSSDIELYNAAKLAGNAMQQAQESTAGEASLDNEALLAAVAAAVFNVVDTIEEIASSNQTLIGQAQAEVLIDDLALSNDLEVTVEDIETAEEIASLDFNLGAIDYLNILNMKEESSPSQWQRVTYTRFRLPTPENTLSIEDYRDQIPQDYEIGLFDSNNTLLTTYRFDETQYDDTQVNRIHYDFENNNTIFAVWTQETQISADVGNYEFMLCTRSCSETEGRIKLGEASVTALDPDHDLDDYTRLVDIQENELEVYVSEDGAFSVDGERQVFVSQPALPHNHRYRVEIGVDADESGYPASTRSVYARYPFTPWETIPESWITDEKSFVVRLRHRDAVRYEDISWEARTNYRPLTLGMRDSFATSIEDIYVVEYDMRHFDPESETPYADSFTEGVTFGLYYYLAGNNPLTSLQFADENEATLVDLCLSNDIPTTQSELAVYGEYHAGDGSEDYFEGCQNKSLYTSFGMSDTSKWSELWLGGTTDWETGTKEVLEVWLDLSQGDTDGEWNEPGNQFESLKYIVAGFQDGSTQQVEVDLNKPDHDFSIGHGTPGVAICSLDADNLHVSWTPPDWLQDDFDAGELSIELRIEPRDVNHSRLFRYRNRTQIGAASTVVPRTAIASTDGTVIDYFDFEARFIDQNFYRWKHDTFKVRIRDRFTASEISEAASCN